MTPIFIKDFYKTDLFDVLKDEAPWVNRDAPRDECFMAVDVTKTYTYGTPPTARTYTAAPMHPCVQDVMDILNAEGNQYNICVLNYYKDKNQHLGWHADDSPEQDLDHPIAVVSFGVARYLYVKEKTFKGTIPDENKFLMSSGSLFVMPGGFQYNHVHKIPKHFAECGGRISLTFRKLDR